MSDQPLTPKSTLELPAFAQTPRQTNEGLEVGQRVLHRGQLATIADNTGHLVFEGFAYIRYDKFAHLKNGAWAKWDKIEVIESDVTIASGVHSIAPRDFDALDAESISHAKIKAGRARKSKMQKTHIAIRQTHKQRSLTAPLCIAKKLTRKAIGQVAVIAENRVMGRRLAIDLQKYHPDTFWIRTVGQRVSRSSENAALVLTVHTQDRPPLECTNEGVICGENGVGPVKPTTESDSVVAASARVQQRLWVDDAQPSAGERSGLIATGRLVDGEIVVERGRV